MERIKTSHYDDLIKSIAEKHGVEVSDVKDVKDSLFRFIRKKIGELDFTNVKSEEEFNKVKKNFNIPRIGKLYASYRNLKKINYNKNVRRHQQRRGQD